MHSQKGFSSLLILSIIVLVIVLILALSQISNNQKTNKPVSTTITKQTASKNPSNIVIFMANDTSKLKTASYDGTNISSLSNELDNETLKNDGILSPDRKYLLITGYITSNQVYKGIQLPKPYYATLSLMDNSVKKINTDSLNIDLPESGEISGWVSDSKNVLFTSAIPPLKFPGTAKRNIGIYNIETNEIKQLYSDDIDVKSSSIPLLRPIYYDANNQQISFTDNNELTKVNLDSQLLPYNTAYTVDLITNKKTEFPWPDNVRGDVKLFIKSNATSALYSDKKLEIFDINKPLTPISTIDITNEKNYGFSGSALWSSDHKFFSINVLKGYDQNTDALRIYSKEGQLIASYALPNSNSASGIFSADDSKILIENSYDQWWNLIDIKTGKILNKASKLNFSRVVAIL